MTANDQTGRSDASARNRAAHTRGGGASGAKSQAGVIGTWAFDSAGPRKYALQLRTASNGNPFLKLVEGVPQDDGTFKKFSIVFWSEDFETFFAKLDEVRRYITEHGIKTPDGHKYDPEAAKRRPPKRS